ETYFKQNSAFSMHANGLRLQKLLSIHIRAVVRESKALASGLPKSLHKIGGTSCMVSKSLNNAKASQSQWLMLGIWKQTSDRNELSRSNTRTKQKANSKNLTTLVIYTKKLPMTVLDG